MKHVFVLNPAAGKRDQSLEITRAIETACKGLNYDIRRSARPGDGVRLSRSAARLGDEVRFYACGGDGTLNEVINGVAGYPNASVTHFPWGSGNDFIKIFSDPKAFRSLERLLEEPEEARFDLIWGPDGCYGLNICSMGFDARIAAGMGRYKRWPLVTGSGAYLLSVVANLVRGVHEHYVVELDGQVFDARQTLICIANGRWYGGGFNPVPEAQPDDGLLDVLLVKDVSRPTVARVVGAYKKGRYKELPDLVQHFSCKKVTIRCDQDSVINIDGELLEAQEATFELIPRAIRFFYPRGLTYK